MARSAQLILTTGDLLSIENHFWRHGRFSLPNAFGWAGWVHSLRGRIVPTARGCCSAALANTHGIRASSLALGIVTRDALRRATLLAISRLRITMHRLPERMVCTVPPKFRSLPGVQRPAPNWVMVILPTPFRCGFSRCQGMDEGAKRLADVILGSLKLLGAFVGGLRVLLPVPA
jgi:hypothetical protein